ncbi:Zinc finger CCCH domain-containing protein 15 [Amphibalanus amphitrite]|uniref:Zinc finger CCCH domain-containing protein 15 n=1 Tax=Amphibalanus amphitrite TaxID=1232801 RepID=A0A6A4VW79_AMPAM|nr:zinc finger CCCH domain-containing protein 15 homolog [Amphibalanus amphitrite]XP_043208634.1 zinc finger CCCH domain-containing protein 15 homolog [Amphibalanus amphitrite]KAF0295082.1 Zinc finger CCCH domain-containing protein 15 [Amphibalanus amphitrite]KAF0300294.1 Zinc finger CCCH domain-containing protein 15 [Amphibalanus amphitrite]
MPPKKANAPSKKTEEKKKAKIVEDKTFGLKNKKGGKQQKFIQQVNKNVKSGGDPIQKKIEEQKKKEKLKKEQEAKEKEILQGLFKPVVEKVDKNVDPKSVLCPFFKQSVCAKGLKCKYSHDLNIGRKVEKRNMYVDSRDTEDSSTWDADKLNDVANAKGGEAEKNKPKTTIICKYFLDAVENSKYGWFWECPSGDKCIYRHALPQGYVLKKDMKKAEKKDEITIEELVEKERAALGSNLTKITYTTFLAWKKRKLAERKKEESKKQAKKKNDAKSGKSGGLSGRDMFMYNPEMGVGDGDLDEGDEGMDLTGLKDEELEEAEKDIVYKTWTLEGIENEQIAEAEAVQAQEANAKAGESGGAVGGATAVDAAPIDENLFDADDLDELEEELDELDISQ